MSNLKNTHVMLRHYGGIEFEHNSVERDAEKDLQSNEPPQNRKLNGEEFGTLPNSLAKGSQANLLSNG